MTSAPAARGTGRADSWGCAAQMEAPHVAVVRRIRWGAACGVSLRLRGRNFFY